MLKVYRDSKKQIDEKDEKRRKFDNSPRDRRGRRRLRGRVGHRIANHPGDGTKALNRETDSVAERRVVVNKVSKTGINAGAIIVARTLGIYVLRSYVGVFYKCASCVMGMFKWLRKDFVQWDRNRRNLPSPERRGLNNDREGKKTMTMLFERRHFNSEIRHFLSQQSEVTEEEIPREISGSKFFIEDRANSEAYRSALQAFLDRRREPGEGSESSQSPKLSPSNNRVEIFCKNTNSEKQQQEENQLIPGVPHIAASEVFEVGWVAGTEDRYLELIAAEWQHTRTALRRSSHPDCVNAVRADLDILTEIRHPHTLLLMGTTRTDEHGVVAIFESVDCTLYNYVHEQGERVSVQGAARCAGQLADALRHAHARGIIHGALSSHCVFLAASGSAKLGGWELAVRENESRPYREWEDRLRTEIFRWQAPEMFYGDSPSRACDVYALALLIWEMCTGRIPWSGLTEAEIERQYIHWERGVDIEAYNFPPLLGNLLEAGLQLDFNKRKLDMNRTRRFLRRVELRYEEEESIYVDRQSNNNNPNVKTFNAPVATSPLVKSPVLTPKRETIEINNSLTGKRLFNSEKISVDQRVKKNSKYEIIDEKNTNLYIEEREKNRGEKLSPVIPCKEITEFHDRTNKKEKKFNNPDCKRNQRIFGKKEISTDVKDKVKRNVKNVISYESSFSESPTATETSNTSSDESANDTMTDLKKLKEILAAKRSNFFYGTSSPTNLKTPESPDIPDVPQSSPRSRERILREARGKNCEPCKPASHKVNLEPQMCKSPNEYDPTLIKPASHQNQRVNLELKQAILHPQTPNLSSASFFETSLWRKEKLICLSKMRKENTDGGKDVSIAVKEEKLSKSLESPKSDSTYIIDNSTAGEESHVAYGDAIFTTDDENRISQSGPLLALKEALDRATNIIRTATSNDYTDESSEKSPIKTLDNSEIIFDEIDAKESVFESMNRSKLGSNNSDEEIKSIERSTINDRDSLIGKSITMDETSPESRIKPEKICSVEKERLKCVSFDQTYADDNMSSTKIDDSLIQRLHNFTCNDSTNGYTTDANDSVNHLAEESLISTAMIFLSSKPQEKGCKTCQHRNLLARRRSLPAGLGQFRSVSNASPLGRLPIRRADVPDNTVEDLYIDDEFGDNLNINMVLLEDEDEPDDQDILSRLLQPLDA